MIACQIVAFYLLIVFFLSCIFFSGVLSGLILLIQASYPNTDSFSIGFSAGFPFIVGISGLIAVVYSLGAFFKNKSSYKDYLKPGEAIPYSGRYSTQLYLQCNISESFEKCLTSLQVIEEGVRSISKNFQTFEIKAITKKNESFFYGETIKFILEQTSDYTTSIVISSEGNSLIKGIDYAKNLKNINSLRDELIRMQ